jgi:hypothetical protein
MSVRATWTSPKHVEAEVTDYFVDDHGNEIDEGNLALVLGQDSDCFVIEGTREQLRAFVEELDAQLDESAWSE